MCMAPLADLITASEAAEPFGVSAETMRRWARTNRVPSVTMPSGRIKFHRSEIERLAANIRTPGGRDAAQATAGANPRPVSSDA